MKYAYFGKYRAIGISDTEVEGSVKIPSSINLNGIWPGRLKLQDDAVIDAYPGLDDDEAIELANEEDSIAEKAEAERLIASKKAQHKSLTRLEFLNRFTTQERIQLRVAEAEDPVIADLFDMIRVAEFIDTSDKSTIDGINYLVVGEYLSEARAKEILA